jgi:hypothetical protein
LMVNMLLTEHAVTPEFMARFGFEMMEPIKVRFIRMSSELAESLDYPSKLSRHPAHIARLIADGEAQAANFLAGFDEHGNSLEPGDTGSLVEGVEQPGPMGTN